MKTDLNCDQCGKDIQLGEEHLSLTKNIEYAEWVPERKRIEIQPSESEQLLTICWDCVKGCDNYNLANMYLKKFEDKKV